MSELLMILGILFAIVLASMALAEQRQIKDQLNQHAIKLEMLMNVKQDKDKP